MRLVLWFLIAVSTVVLLGVMMLSALSMRNDAGRVQGSVEIAAPPAGIWPWLREGDKTKQWVSGLLEVRPGEKNTDIWVMQDPSVGGRVEVTSTITSQDFPREMTVHVTSQPSFEGDQTWRLTDLGNGRTRLDVDGRFKSEGSMARLLEPLVSKSAASKLAHDLNSLKAAVEKR